MLEWSDYEFVLAIHRTGSLSDAARLLRVNQSTVSRAVQRIETRSGGRLFSHGSGRYRISPEGLPLLKIAEEFDRIVGERKAEANPPQEITGVVRLTSIEGFVVGYLVAKLTEFTARFPGVKLEINGSNETLNLLRRGYDVALRLDRERKAQSLVQKKVAEIAIALYEKNGDGRAAGPAASGWIGYEAALAEIPEEKWLRKKLRGATPGLRVSSSLAMEKAIEQGLGMGLLPCFLGDKNAELRRVNRGRPLFVRPLWLIFHPDTRREPSLAGFVKWLSLALERDKGELLGLGH